MSKMPKNYKTLNIPFELAEDIRIIAMKSEIPITWSRVAMNALYAWVAMHKARGAVE